MSELKELLEQNGCSSEFIQDALRYESLYAGDIEAFMDRVEEILLNEEDYEPENTMLDEDELEDEEDDPIHRSDYNYDGNDDNIYFEEEEEEFEADEDEE